MAQACGDQRGKGVSKVKLVEKLAEEFWKKRTDFEHSLPYETAYKAGFRKALELAAKHLETSDHYGYVSNFADQIRDIAEQAIETWKSPR
jgi:hypothetical protein